MHMRPLLISRDALGRPHVETYDEALFRTTDEDIRVYLTRFFELRYQKIRRTITRDQANVLWFLDERLRSDARETVAFPRSQGVRLTVISGHSPETVGAVAADAGIDVRAPPDGNPPPRAPTAPRRPLDPPPRVGPRPALRHQGPFDPKGGADPPPGLFERYLTELIASGRSAEPSRELARGETGGHSEVAGEVRLVGVAQLSGHGGQVSVAVAQTISALLEPTAANQPLGRQADALVEQSLQGALGQIEPFTEIIDPQPGG